MDGDAHLQKVLRVALRQRIVGRQEKKGLVHPFMTDTGHDIISPPIDRDPVDFLFLSGGPGQKDDALDKELLVSAPPKDRQAFIHLVLGREDYQGPLSDVVLSPFIDPSLIKSMGQIGQNKIQEHHRQHKAPGQEHELMDCEQENEVQAHEKDYVFQGRSEFLKGIPAQDVLIGLDCQDQQNLDDILNLKYTRECQSTSFDSLTAHLAIVNVRYMMLGMFQRENTDHRSLGELFYLYVQEVAGITFDHSMKLIMIALLSTVKEFFSLSEEQMSLFVQQFIGNLPNCLRKPLEACAEQLSAA